MIWNYIFKILLLLTLNVVATCILLNIKVCCYIFTFSAFSASYLNLQSLGRQWQCFKNISTGQVRYYTVNNWCDVAFIICSGNDRWVWTNCLANSVRILWEENYDWLAVSQDLSHCSPAKLHHLVKIDSNAAVRYSLNTHAKIWRSRSPATPCIFTMARQFLCTCL